MMKRRCLFGWLMVFSALFILLFIEVRFNMTDTPAAWLFCRIGVIIFHYAMYLLGKWLLDYGETIVQNTTKENLDEDDKKTSR